MKGKARLHRLTRSHRRRWIGVQPISSNVVGLRWRERIEKGGLGMKRQYPNER